MSGSLDLEDSGANPKLEHRAVNGVFALYDRLWNQHSAPISCALRAKHAPELPSANHRGEIRFSWPKPNLIGYQTRLLRFHALSRLPPCLSPQAFFCRMRIFPGSDWMGIVGLETAADGCMQMLRVRPVKWPVASAASTPGRGDRPVPALNPLLLLHAGAALRLHSAWGNESPTTTRFSLLSTVWSRDHGGTVTPIQNSRNRARGWEKMRRLSGR